MNKCGQCGVYIIDNTEVCPLCRCVCTEDETAGGTAREQPAGRPEFADGMLNGARYPDVRLRGRKLELIARIVLFISIVIGTLCVILNYNGKSGVWWSLAVIGGLAYVQLIMFFMVENEYAGYRSKTIVGTACGIAYMVLVDWVFGFTRWSLNYALPAAFLLIDTAIIVLMFVNMRSWQSYLLFQIFMILCSGVCMLLYYLGVITEPVMSYVAFGISCMMFLATFIIGGRRAVNELKRRFHVM